MAIRDRLDLEYIAAALLQNKTFKQIAERETTRLGIKVSRNVIAGVSRDIKSERLSLSRKNRRQDTYRYGIEEEKGIPVFNGHQTLTGDVVVISDIHLPKTDFDLAERVVDVARYYGIKKLHIAGDLFDAGSSAKHHKRKVRPPTISYELKKGRELLKYYANWFNEIWFTPGNHDDWFMENLQGDLEFFDFAEMLTIVPGLRTILRTSPYDRITHYSGGQKWVVSHQQNYSKNKLVIGNIMAQKFQANVVVTHNHFSAIGLDEWGRYIILDIGGLHEPSMFDYVQLKTNKMPNMNKGFGIIIDGRGELWTDNPYLTDWSRIT